MLSLNDYRGQGKQTDVTEKWIGFVQHIVSPKMISYFITVMHAFIGEYL